MKTLLLLHLQSATESDILKIMEQYKAALQRVHGKNHEPHFPTST